MARATKAQAHSTNGPTLPSAQIIMNSRVTNTSLRAQNQPKGRRNSEVDLSKTVPEYRLAEKNAASRLRGHSRSRHSSSPSPHGRIAPPEKNTADCTTSHQSTPAAASATARFRDTLAAGAIARSLNLLAQRPKRSAASTPSLSSPWSMSTITPAAAATSNKTHHTPQTDNNTAIMRAHPKTPSGATTTRTTTTNPAPASGSSSSSPTTKTPSQAAKNKKQWRRGGRSRKDRGRGQTEQPVHSYAPEDRCFVRAKMAAAKLSREGPPCYEALAAKLEADLLLGF